MSKEDCAQALAELEEFQSEDEGNGTWEDGRNDMYTGSVSNGTAGFGSGAKGEEDDGNGVMNFGYGAKDKEDDGNRMMEDEEDDRNGLMGPRGFGSNSGNVVADDSMEWNDNGGGNAQIKDNGEEVVGNGRLCLRKVEATMRGMIKESR